MSSALRRTRPLLLVTVLAVLGAVAWFFLAREGVPAVAGPPVTESGPGDGWWTRDARALAQGLAARGSSPVAGNVSFARSSAALNGRRALAQVLAGLRGEIERRWAEEAAELDPPHAAGDLPGLGTEVPLEEARVVRYYQDPQRMHALVAFEDPGRVVSEIFDELEALEGAAGAVPEVAAARERLEQEVRAEIEAMRSEDGALGPG